MNPRKMLILICALAGMCLLVIWALWPDEANAQTVCLMHDTMVSHLTKSFDEFLTGRALASKDWMVEWYTSAKGTWTQITTGTDHLSCITGAGEGWESLDPTKQGSPT